MDAEEAVTGILDVVPHFAFCKFQYDMQRACSQCPYTSDTQSCLARVLRVAIPDNSPIFDVKKSINDTILESRVTDMVCPRCNRETVSEKLTMTTLPPFLIIQLLFFNNNLEKLDNITVPENEIQVSSSQSQTTYRLHCIIEHIGPTMGVGHYVCYFLKNDKWFCANDRRVQQVDDGHLPTQPYISVYKKT